MDIMAELNKIVDDYKGEHVALDENTIFDELGLDSLDKLELMMEMEDRFGIQFPDDPSELVITTAGDLKAKIAELMA